MDPVATISMLPPEILCGILDDAKNDASVRRVCRLWHDIIEDKYQRLLCRILDCCGEQSEVKAVKFADNSSLYFKIDCLRRKWPLEGFGPKSSGEWTALACRLLKSGSGDVCSLRKLIAEKGKKLLHPDWKTFDAFYRENPKNILGPADKLSGVTLLDLRFSGTEELPSSIQLLRSLETLILSGNKLTALPDEIGSLENLKHLDLAFNRLEGLPHSLVKLVRLVDLNLERNHFNKLPPELTVMKEWPQLKIRLRCSRMSQPTQ
jgi:hypothetical protein